MLYTQTSLSLVYNLERVSKSLHCYCATYQFGIVAWLRLEPNSYSTKLYSLHRRCSFGPVAVALGQLSESFVLSPLYCSLELVAAKCRCRCVLDVQLWLKIWEWRYYPVLIRSWRCAAGAVLWAVLCAMSEVVMIDVMAWCGDSWCAARVNKTLDVVHRYALLVSNSDML